jgi:hypothetical protein
MSDFRGRYRTPIDQSGNQHTETIKRMAKGQTQEQKILDYLKAGNYLTKMDAARKLDCANLGSVVSSLRSKKYPILNEDRVSSNGKYHVAYYYDASQVDALQSPTETGKGRSTDAASRLSSFDIFDQSSTALRRDTPPQIGGTEMHNAVDDAVLDQKSETEVAESVADVEAEAEAKPEPMEPATEIREHHLGNPGDEEAIKAAILKAFREYCAPYGGKRVPITGDWSRQLLRLNLNLPEGTQGFVVRNRKLNLEKQERFKNFLRTGTMIYTNVGIGFNINGNLYDGQSRLTASRDTGITFYADVSFDMPLEAAIVVDSRGSARSAGDIAAMSGVFANNYTIVAAASHLYRKDHGIRMNKPLTDMEIHEASRRYPGLDESVRMATNLGIRGPRAIFAAVHYLARQIDKALADQVFEELRTGAISDPKDPVLVARNRLMADAASLKKQFRGRDGEKRARVMLSRMFNYRRKGITLKQYILDTGDDWPEA